MARAAGVDPAPHARDRSPRWAGTTTNWPTLARGVRQQPAYAANATRSLKPEFLVLTAICTHLGCIPSYRPEPGAADLGDDWPGGFYCPCHGSKFDLAGRVFRNVPAPTNMEVPPHSFRGAGTLADRRRPGRRPALSRRLQQHPARATRAAVARAAARHEVTAGTRPPRPPVPPILHSVPNKCAVHRN